MITAAELCGYARFVEPYLWEEEDEPWWVGEVPELPPDPPEALKKETPMDSLVDRRIEIKRQIKALTEELEKIDADLWEEYTPGEIVLGAEGRGYVFTVSEKRVYGREAANKLPWNILAELASLSTTSLERLVKAKKMEQATMDALPYEVKEQKVIREYIPEEAKVF